MEIFIKSLASGLITMIILIISKFLSPKLAGAIGGIPIVFAISYVMLTLHNQSLSRDFLIGGIYGALAAIFFSLLLIWLNIQFTKTHLLNFTIAYILCFFFALILVNFTSQSK